jgi:hypothetical protein
MQLSREISEAEMNVDSSSSETKKRRVPTCSITGLTIASRKFSLTGLLDTIMKSVAMCESAAPSQPIKMARTESCEDDLSIIDMEEVEAYLA